MGIGWTPEREEALRRFVMGDRGYREIAAAFDNEFSPETLASKVRRMGLVKERAWSKVRIGDLRSAWSEGLSAAAIAAMLNKRGMSVSRSAVLGKIYRLGLSNTRPAVAPKEKRRVDNTFRVPGVRYTPPPKFDDSAIPIGQRRTLNELTPETCRWPVGEPGDSGFFFCGHAVEDGKPYCSVHCARAYEPSRVRSRPFLLRRNAA